MRGAYLLSYQNFDHEFIQTQDDFLLLDITNDAFRHLN
jgi:hypothetical protein